MDRRGSLCHGVEHDTVDFTKTASLDVGRASP